MEKKKVLRRAFSNTSDRFESKTKKEKEKLFS